MNVNNIFVSSVEKKSLKEILTGKMFESDNDLKLFISQLQTDTKQNYFQRDQKRKDDLKSENRKNANENIRSRFIRYQCIHGPVVQKNRIGKRRTQ